MTGSVAYAGDARELPLRSAGHSLSGELKHQPKMLRKRNKGAAMKENKEDRARYDSAYKALFSNPRIFCQLVKGFVEENFVKDLNPEHFKRLENRSFISPEYLKRETDLIYHIAIEEREVYFYILLEFQSTPDKRMPIRLFSYLLLFHFYNNTISRGVRQCTALPSRSGPKGL